MRISSRSTFAVTAILLLFGGFLAAQQSAYVVGSTVTGHVFCADSNAPARFSKVLLRSAEGDHTGDEFIKRLQDNLQKVSEKSGEAARPAKPLNDDKRQALANASKGFTQAMDMMNASTVGLNGEFRFAGVKAGTYYVHAIYAGYIDPFDQFSDEDFSSTDPAMRARIAQIPTVTVTGTDSAHASCAWNAARPSGALSSTRMAARLPVGPYPSLSPARTTVPPKRRL